MSAPVAAGGDGRTMGAAGAVAWLRSFAAAVSAQRDELTELDAAIGDADHGVNMDRGLQAVVAKLVALDAGGGGGAPAEAPLGPLFKTVGMTLVSTVGGAAGPLYGTFFLEFGKAADDGVSLTSGPWADAYSAAVAGVQARGKAEPGDKTMVDALLPARDALAEAARAGRTLGEALRTAADAAAEGMRATTPLVARKGRASYLGERSAGHQDPGATSAWLLLETAAAALGGAPGEDVSGSAADGSQGAAPGQADPA